MIIFIASAISLLLFAVSCYLIFKGVSAPEERRGSAPALLLGMVAATICVGCIAGSLSVQMLMLEILPALAGMLVLESSFWERRKVCRALWVLAGAYAVPVTLHVAVAAGWVGMPSISLTILICLPFVLFPPGLFVTGMCLRLRDVKMILKTGTIWTNVCLVVEVTYLLLYVLLALFYISVSVISPDGFLLIFTFLTGLMLATLGLRDADDVLFIFWRGQERRILESMKITKVETAVDPMSIEDIYQDIYERVVIYFEEEKPFLDNELTINDLAKVLYSNKLYISRAISQFTGRNFCQFVNYYRITYSMDLFRNNNDLKIHDLASGSGFNSDVSYNMAFRLFMGETPGEWCRKERTRKLRTKK